MEFLIAYGYIGVFIAAFLAATILPFSSEVVLAGVMATGASYWPLILAATAGNVLGGMSCFWLGHLGKREWIVKYLRMSPETVNKWTDYLQGKGSWMAFFVFLPGVGDFFAVALGLLRANVWSVLGFMTLGKLLRYVVLGEGLQFLGKHWEVIVSFCMEHPALLAVIVVSIIGGLYLYLLMQSMNYLRGRKSLKARRVIVSLSAIITALLLVLIAFLVPPPFFISTILSSGVVLLLSLPFLRG